MPVWWTHRDRTRGAAAAYASAHPQPPYGVSWGPALARLQQEIAEDNDSEVTKDGVVYTAAMATLVTAFVARWQATGVVSLWMSYDATLAGTPCVIFRHPEFSNEGDYCASVDLYPDGMYVSVEDRPDLCGYLGDTSQEAMTAALDALFYRGDALDGQRLAHTSGDDGTGACAAASSSSMGALAPGL